MKPTRKSITLAAAGLSALAMGGCGHSRMRPAPSAQVLRSAPWSAYVEQAGIRVSASTDVWVAAADGSSQPKIFIANAYSPASVR